MTSTATSATGTGPAKIGVLTLTAMVVGSMVGAGVFSLPSRFAEQTGISGALVAWAIAGSGMLLLAFVFQTLAVRRPTLDSGVFAYAKAGFGEYPGFLSAAGYWASACFGNVTYWILITTTVGALVPALGAGDTWLAVGVSLVGIWFFWWLVRRGITEAAAINRVVTIAKVVPIVVFVLLCLFLLDPQVLAHNWTGGSYEASLFEQVSGTMLATVFVFLGVEGASVYSRHARRREDVGRATVLGFLGVLALFASVTLVSYGILPLEEIAALRQPSMGGVLEAAVGTWGAVLVGVGLIVSVLGAYLAWTLMAAEVLAVAAKDGSMPRRLAAVDRRDVPRPALLVSTVTVSGLLLLTKLSEDAFTLAFNLTAALSLVPFLLAAGFAVKIALPRRGDGDAEPAAPSARRRRELVVAALATVYSAFLIVAAGLDYLLLSALLYAPLTVLFVVTRREQGRRVFTRTELALFVLVLAGAAVGAVGLATGAIVL